MRWLVTGAGGMLATDLVPELEAHGHEVVALDRASLDVTDPDAVTSAVGLTAPDVVVNTAAYTAVDAAESDQAAALAVNGGGPTNLAKGCGVARAVLLHLSTDYVLDGQAGVPCAEDAPTRPRSVYGRTKLAGEDAVRELLPERGYVVRTAWLYGTGGPSFVRTMLTKERALRPDGTVDVVDDQHGQPTSTPALATALRQLGEAAVQGRAAPGTYHATARGQTTWYGLAREVFRLVGADPDRVRATTTAAYPRPAPRPAWSVLAHTRWDDAGLPPLPEWRAGLAAVLPAMA